MKKLTVNLKEISDVPNGHLVTFEGDFDGYATENVTEIQNLMDFSEEGAVFIFDFEKLNYLNSYAIGHLVSWHTHLNKIGGRIFIAGTTKDVADIFTILGIDSLFKLYPNTEAVMKELKK